MSHNINQKSPKNRQHKISPKKIASAKNRYKKIANKKSLTQKSPKNRQPPKIATKNHQQKIANPKNRIKIANTKNRIKNRQHQKSHKNRMNLPEMSYRVILSITIVKLAELDKNINIFELENSREPVQKQP